MTKRLFILILLALFCGILSGAVFGPLFGWLLAPNIFLVALCVLVYQESWREHALVVALVLGYFAEVYGGLPPGTAIFGFPLLLGLYILLGWWFLPLKTDWRYGAVVVVVWEIFWLCFFWFYSQLLGWFGQTKSAVLLKFDWSFPRVFVAVIFSIIFYVIGLGLYSLWGRIWPSKSSDMI